MKLSLKTKKLKGLKDKINKMKIEIEIEIEMK